MALLGYQFDKMRVDPSADALLYNYLNGNNNGVIPTYKDGMQVTASGLVLTILPGACIIEGRLIVLTEPQAVTVPMDSGKILALTVDLSKMNMSTGDPIDSSYIVTNNQIKFELRDDVDASNQDLNNGGTVYSQPLGAYETQGTAAKWYPNTRFYAPYTTSQLTEQLVRANTPYIHVLTTADFFPDAATKMSSFSGALIRLGPLVMLQLSMVFRANTTMAWQQLIKIPNGWGFGGNPTDHFGTEMSTSSSASLPRQSIYQSGPRINMNGGNCSGSQVGGIMWWITYDDYATDKSGYFENTASRKAGFEYPIR